MHQRRWHILALLLLGATLVSCGQATPNGADQSRDAPADQHQRDPVEQTPQPAQPGEY